MRFITLRQSDVLACPFAILVPTHYRSNGTCRCNDPTHTEMKSWGYYWHPVPGVWSSKRPPRVKKPTSPAR